MVFSPPSLPPHPHPQRKGQKKGREKGEGVEGGGGGGGGGGDIFLSYSCHISVVVAETLSYSLCFSNQTDQGDQMEGLEGER